MRLVTLFIVGLWVSPCVASSPEADRIWLALTTRNPSIPKNAETFVRQYVPVIAGPLKPLDNFIAVVEGRENKVCNLLCQAHIAPAFFADDDVTATDLIAYAFTATCYGILPEIEQPERPLKELDDALKSAVGPYPTSPEARKVYRAIAGTTRDRVLLHRAVGDALFAAEPTVRAGGRKIGGFPAKSKYRYIQALWRNTPLGRGFAASATQIPARPAYLKAAEEACQIAKR